MLSHYTPGLLKEIVRIVTVSLHLRSSIDLSLTSNLRLQEYAPLLPTRGGVDFYPSIEPYNARIFENSPPSAWPREADKPNFALPIRCRWSDAKNDEFWLDRLRDITKEIQKIALAERCTTPETPVYYNLALDGTDVADIYRGNLTALEQIRKQVDPKNVMNRTGGFRIRGA